MTRNTYELFSIGVLMFNYKSFFGQCSNVNLKDKNRAFLNILPWFVTFYEAIFGQIGPS